MKRILIFALGMIGFWPVLNAQKVVSSAGEHNTIGNIQVSWTLREPVIETVSGGNSILTQGFHQTKLMVTPVLSIFENMQIKVFPNPTNEFINISLKGMQMSNCPSGWMT